MRPDLITEPKLLNILEELKKVNQYFISRNSGLHVRISKKWLNLLSGKSAHQAGGTAGSLYWIYWKKDPTAGKNITGRQKIFIVLKLLTITICLHTHFSRTKELQGEPQYGEDTVKIGKLYTTREPLQKKKNDHISLKPLIIEYILELLNNSPSMCFNPHN